MFPPFNSLFDKKISITGTWRCVSDVTAPRPTDVVIRL